ncbi:DMT family transporter [Oxalobacteraceae bacterium A2-2]
MNPAYSGYAWCLLSSVFSAAATYLIKRAMGGAEWNLVRLAWLAGAGGSYALGFACYALALQRMQISVAYPVMTGFTMLLVACTGWLLLGESLTPVKLGGMALLAMGAWLLTR